MKRSDAIKEIALCEGLIVSNLGFPSRELFAAADRPENFYMLGSMGLVSSIGLGLALCQHKRVYVIDGDGSLLMNLGALVTIAHHAPDNLCLVIMDNKVYGSTGNQPTYTAQKTDLAAVAKAAGNKNVVKVKTISSLRKTLVKFSQTNAVIIAAVESGNKNVPIIPFAPGEIKKRFVQALCSHRET
ncbi:MAG: sulfopyruvate decarboxylase subunit beta [Pseudomonadota bacterium]